jgi:hypothetical protein
MDYLPIFFTRHAETVADIRTNVNRWRMGMGRRGSS